MYELDVATSRVIDNMSLKLDVHGMRPMRFLSA